MNIRHLVTKSFDSDNDIRRSVIFEGMPIISQEFIDNPISTTLDFSQSVKTQAEMKLEPDILKGKDAIVNSPLGNIVMKNDETMHSLSTIFDFKVKQNSEYADALPEGTTFEDIFKSQEIQDYLADTASQMFPNINPQTDELDIDLDSFYTPYIPMVVLTDTMSCQSQDGKTYFNPEGTVSVAEFLDGLNAIKYGMNSNRSRKKTLDNISTDEDYFNEGYNECLKGFSSLFFNLYRRDELLTPITRCELAYIITLCWKQFMGKYNDLYGGQFYLGFNFDWENPLDMLTMFIDGTDYKISKLIRDKDADIISLDIRDYKGIYTMTEFKQNIRDGKSALPISMFMPLIELDILSIFNFEYGELAPLKEVSRGELAYVLTQLARLFPLQYKYK